jgi:hypothetical protein
MNAIQLESNGDAPQSGRVCARRSEHSDHETITLPFWHRVIMNTETRSRTMAKVAFLD